MKSILIKIADILISISMNSKYNKYKTQYKIPKSFKFNGPSIIFYGEGEILVGNNSYIGSYSTVNAAKDCFVKIGNNCAISHNVRMYTSSNLPDQNFNTTEPKQKIYGSISIGDGVWIGANTFINPGITIADNVIVGANSVVTKNLEENGIYAGCPAILLRFKNV